MSEYLDPEYSGTFGDPDASLQDWLSNPAAADWVKQKAVEHAGSVLGFSDPYGNNIDPTSGMPTLPSGAPVPPPEAPKPFVLNKDGQRLTNGKTYTDQPDGPVPVPAPATIQNSFDPTPAETVPVPVPRPESAPGATDVSAKKKEKGDKGDAISDFAKTLGAVKPIAPPPLNPVGTPGVRSPSAINAPQISQLLQLMGAQSRPDPIQTLGRLLVAGKA